MENKAILPFPPKDYMFMGEDQERSIRNANILLDAIKGRYSLGSRFLDIGCGYGRLAFGLHRQGYFGQYLGIDILKKHIDWLSENVTPVAPSLQFRHLDIRNGRYNPNGSIDANDFQIPFFPDPPEVITMFSVFTHMYEGDIRRYLKSVAGVMNDKSTLCATFFLLNQEERMLRNDAQQRLRLEHRLNDHCYYLSKDDPLHAIGFEESVVIDWIYELGLRLDSISYGSWCGRKGLVNYQDTLLIRRQ